MKKIITILSAAAVLFSAFTSCDIYPVDREIVPEEELSPSSLVVVKSDLVIPAEGGSASIEMASESPVKASTTSSWLTLSVSGNVITATAPASEELISRYAKVVVEAGDESTYLTVQQYGWATSGFELNDIRLSSDAAEFDYPYSYTSTMVANVDVPWITLTVTENNLHIAIAENFDPASDGNTSRVGKITWQLGVDGGVATVTQRNANFMREDSNWTVTYLGVQDYEGSDVEEIQNTVGNPNISGGYLFSYFSKKEFTASGLSVADYIDAVVAPSIIDEFNGYIESYRQYGLDLVFGDFLYYDTDFEIFDIFDPGDYYGVVVGFTEDGESTGHYAYCEFTKTESGLGYDSWIGEWTSEYLTYKDTWVITEKEKGVSYTINGIEGVTNAPITAEYDEASKNIVVRSYEGLGEREMGSYGVCSLGFYGAALDTRFYRPTASNYVIFTGKLSQDGSAAALTPGTITSSGEEVTFEHCKYIGTSSEGKYVGIHSNANSTPLPHTITKNGGGSGGGGGEASAYKKWLGNWKVASSDADFTITVSQDKENESYFVSNWQMDYDWLGPMAASFNPSNGGLVLYANDAEPIASDVNIGADENADLFFLGNIIYSDGEEYYITSGKAYEVAEATLDSDSKATIKGLDCNLGSDGTFPFCRLQIGAITPSDNVYFFNGKPDHFPLTMTKAASGSSVKSTSVSTSKQVNQTYDISRYGFMRVDDCLMDAVNGAVQIPARIKKLMKK